MTHWPFVLGALLGYYWGEAGARRRSIAESVPLEDVNLLHEHTYDLPGVGTIHAIGDPRTGFAFGDIEFGEFLDLSGGIYPLTRHQCVDILKTAQTESMAMQIIEDGTPAPQN